MREAVGLFVLCLVVYHLNGRPVAEVDCMAAPYTAWALLTRGSFDLSPYREMDAYVGIHIRERTDGSRVSIRTPGSALAAIPFIAPFTLFHEMPLRLVNMTHLGKLTAAVSVALAVVFFFLTCRMIAPAAAKPASYLLAFGTCAWCVASQSLWTHGPALFWLSLAQYLLFRSLKEGNERICFSAGLALGMAVACRPTTAVFAPATGLALLMMRQWRMTAWLTVGGLIPVVPLYFFNVWLFQEPVLGGYANDRWEDRPPLWVGLMGLLVAPSRGVFIYTPAFAIAAYAGIRLLRNPAPTETSVPGSRLLVLSWVLASIATLLFYSRWWCWQGGWCYGPRFLIETMPTACLLFALGYESLNRFWRWLACLLIAVSIVVQLVGIVGGKAYVPWHERHEREDFGRCLFELNDTQIEAHTRATVQEARSRINRWLP